MALTTIDSTINNVNLVNVTSNDTFYTPFDSVKDIINNTSKLYYYQIVPQTTTINVGQFNGIYTGSYNSNILFTAHDRIKYDTSSYKSIQSLLRSDLTTGDSESWIPVSSSGTIVSKSTYITAISFANDSIGDKLSFGLAGNQFSFKIGGTTYYTKKASEFTGLTYNINSQFKSQTSNFGLIMNNGSTDVSNIRGLVFGQLGLLMFYDEVKGNLPNITTGFTASNIVKQQRLNSKTYFCRVTNQKYNASSNPTWGEYNESLGYTTVRNSDDPFTAITTIGLYNDNNELLAVAKLSQPMLKLQDTQLHAKIVLQY